MRSSIPPFVMKAARALSEDLHARGVMLFGSRARGDAKDDDDWDVVAVLRNFSPLPTQFRLVTIVPHSVVHARAIAQDELFEKATDGDHIASAIAHDGILLVGHVSLPVDALPAALVEEMARSRK